MTSSVFPKRKKSRLVSGIAAQYESEVIYNSIQKDLEDQGVIFVDTDTAVQKYPEIVKKYFGKCIPSNDNKFSALNTAAWSGGSFVYVPKGVHVDIPLQAYFRINTPNMGQFERTLIIADEDRTCTMWKAAPHRSTRPIRCIPVWWRFSSSRMPRALHHRAELVEQRLQSGDAACLRA